MGLSFHAFHPDAAAVLLMDACQHLDQRGLAGAVFPHQGMDLAFTQGEIHLVQRLGARKLLIDPAHRQYRVVLHLG